MTEGGVVMLNGCEALGGQSLVRCFCSAVDERTRRMNELLWCFLSRIGPEFLVKVRLLLKRLLKETKEGQEAQLPSWWGLDSKSAICNETVEATEGIDLIYIH